MESPGRPAEFYVVGKLCISVWLFLANAEKQNLNSGSPADSHVLHCSKTLDKLDLRSRHTRGQLRNRQIH